MRERMNDVRGKVGFLTEAPGLWDRLTVKLNLLVYARLYGVKNPERAVGDALGMFGLEDRAGSLAAQLSKGMKQKVAIARALLHSPPVLLLDEPTSGLDPQTARLVRELVLTLRDKGHTIVISTHNLDEAERVRVRLTGSTPHHAEAARRAGARDLQLLEDGFSLAMDNVDRDTPAIVRALVEAGADVLAVIPAQAPLEDVYLALINDQKEKPIS